MSSNNIIDRVFEEALKNLSDLISFKTVSGSSNIDLINYCENKLSKIGAESFKTFDKEKKRVNLFSTLKNKTNNNGKGVILSGHTDVVPASKNWSSDPFKAIHKNNKVYGRGACDMKGFIACALAFAPIFAKEKLNKPIHFAFTFDEETACQGAPLLIKELSNKKLDCGICIVGEPTNMKIIDAHKGCYEYTTYFKGMAGHGSQPDKAVNAVEYAVRYIDKLMQIREQLKKRVPKKSIFDPPYTTLQVGAISGGIARNVIADKCRVDWELRPVVKEDGIFVNQELDKFVQNELLPNMKKVFPDSSVEKEIIGEIIGFNKIQKSNACNLISNITGDNSRDTVSFGTEAGLFQEIGISTVVCGPGSIEQAHKIDEFVSFDQLKLCIKMLDGVKKYLIN